MKIVKNFQPKIFILTAVKNRCMLHRRVFVMLYSDNITLATVRATKSGRDLPLGRKSLLLKTGDR